MQEYFEPKIGRKIKMFSLDRKSNILKKECTLRRQHVACGEQKKESYFKKTAKGKKKLSNTNLIPIV